MHLAPLDKTLCCHTYLCYEQTQHNALSRSKVTPCSIRVLFKEVTYACTSWPRIGSQWRMRIRRTSRQDTATDTCAPFEAYFNSQQTDLRFNWDSFRPASASIKHTWPVYLITHSACGDFIRDNCYDNQILVFT